MKKIKELWSKNRIVFVLVCILIVCFIAIIIVASSFFMGGNKSTYGDRLDNISEYEITEEFKDSYKNGVKESKLVKDVSLRTSGRIIYIIINFGDNTTLDEAKSVAAKSVDLFSERVLGYYDLEFTIKSEATEDSDGFTLMGARNSNGNGVIWNNNTKVEESEKE